MFFRIALGAGLLALGYFVGREMGRAESENRQAGQEPRSHEPGADKDQAVEPPPHPTPQGAE